MKGCTRVQHALVGTERPYTGPIVWLPNVPTPGDLMNDGALTVRVVRREWYDDTRNPADLLCVVVFEEVEP